MVASKLSKDQHAYLLSSGAQGSTHVAIHRMRNRTVEKYPLWGLNLPASTDGAIAHLDDLEALIRRMKRDLRSGALRFE